MEFWALYLPAFHRIKENDEWWGEGFTEWDNVKKGKPLFEGHVQPLEPLNGYYDLSKIEYIEQQVRIANKYKVDGFIFYHYWFKNGKQLLEKPAELLLCNKSLNIKFSFCWANEPWARTWDGKNTNLLMPQEYGNKEEWIKHIKYLINFFKDHRYHKIDGRPVLYVYSVSNIPRFQEMLDVWNNYLELNGLDKLYLIEFISTFNKKPSCKLTEAVLEFEPLYSTRFDISIFNKLKRVMCKKLGITDYQDYDKLWKLIINRDREYHDRSILRSCFVGWDNSPRKGKNSMVVLGASPAKFKKYIRELVNSNRKGLSKDYLVINAWNEWGEGAILEPDKNNGYQFLEAIRDIKDEINS